jgi:hypothetical protein
MELFTARGKLKKFFFWQLEMLQISVPLGTDHCSSEEYPCTHVDACVARTWISYRWASYRPWCTQQFSCGCEQFYYGRSFGFRVIKVRTSSNAPYTYIYIYSCIYIYNQQIIINRLSTNYQQIIINRLSTNYHQQIINKLSTDY